MRPWIVCSLLAIVAGCTKTVPATQIFVEVQSDISVNQLSRVAVGVEKVDGSPLFSRCVCVGVGPGCIQWPLSIGLGPNGMDDAPFRVWAKGYAADCTEAPIVEQTAVVSFVQGSSLELGLYLYSGCENMHCGEGMTCSLGKCVSEGRPSLPPLGSDMAQPADFAKASDLSAGDLGVADLDTSDLAVDDSGRSDLGEEDLSEPDLFMPDLFMPDLLMPDLALPPSCKDGIKNGSETDLDCGGPMCTQCLDGKACALAKDCQSAVCTGNLCQVAKCGDKVCNGGETQMSCCGDCGCAMGQSCFMAGCKPSTVTLTIPVNAGLAGDGEVWNAPQCGNCQVCAGGTSNRVGVDHPCNTDNIVRDYLRFSLAGVTVEKLQSATLFLHIEAIENLPAGISLAEVTDFKSIVVGTWGQPVIHGYGTLIPAHLGAPASFSKDITAELVAALPSGAIAFRLKYDDEGNNNGLFPMSVTAAEKGGGNAPHIVLQFAP